VDITEVRIKLMEDPQERLQAFCSITFDHCFVIRDLKIIEGTKGSFVAMPSRKLTDRCPRCNTKNQLRALYCNQCGVHLLDDRAGKDADGRAKLYADIAHPINSRCRELIQNKVMDAFREEQVRARLPGYVCTYDDYDYDADDSPVSYGSMVSEMGKGVRAHAPHPAPKGTHFHSDAPASKATAKHSDDFGAGIG
jgi:stage V sporulation protein G